MTDLKLSHSYRTEGGRSYRLVPTLSNRVNLEVNGVTWKECANRSAALKAAIADAEDLGGVDAEVLSNMGNISYWQEAMVDVGPEED